MEKYAKYSPKWKASGDPTQEKLRSLKAHWNSKSSEFIEDFLHFKWLFNGRPGKFHSEKSPLSKSLPADPKTIIGSLDVDFKDIVQEANYVINAQSQYASSRKRKVEKSASKNSELYSFGSEYKNLVDFKKYWNKKSKDFLSDFINFIWLINGKSNKFHMERSSIGEAIPSDPVTIIASISSDFDQLVSGAKAAISHQENLHNSMKNKTSTLKYKNIKMASDEQLEAEASNRLSRFWTKLTNPAFGYGDEAKERRKRKSLLSIAGPLYADFALLQKLISQSSPESVIEAIVTFNKLEDKWKMFQNTLGAPKESIIEEGNDQKAPESKKEDSELVKKAKSIIEEFKANYSNYPADKPEVSRLVSEISRNITRIDLVPEQEKDAVAQEIITAWETLKPLIKSALNHQAVYHMNKLAQHFISKMLGKARHSLWGDGTTEFRMSSFEDAENARTNLNDIMDSLEDTLDESLINLKVQDITASMKNIKKNLVSLAKDASRVVDNSVIKEFIFKNMRGSEADEFDKAMERALRNQKLRQLVNETKITPDKEVKIKSTPSSSAKEEE